FDARQLGELIGQIEPLLASDTDTRRQARLELMQQRLSTLESTSLN
ncbi:MAG: hypothetical protein HQL47_10995, partial [Gammaproteobacteria bacterium]|nr:hypothetical protein [Gammaproteobacteria bacterium]